ncbi:MAG TPA: mechanosensitive ion channel domain-containing protein [Pirellulales bacterium]|jgi:small-conductance mechanosensitive channel
MNLLTLLAFALSLATSIVSAAQLADATAPATQDAAKATPAAPHNTSPPATKVDVAPLARDDEIQTRLLRILRVAELFENPQVTVKDGVVFLDGRTSVDANKDWAGDLARNTEDVVAVVNHIEVVHTSLWDFGPAVDSLKQMEVNLVRSLPLIACGVAILGLSFAAAVAVTRWLRHGLERKVQAPLLREVFARCGGFLVLVIGLYVTLRIANLTHLALTILGGTGLLGLVLGIAFGNITENFLASILLSMQQPFHIGDLVQIADIMGYVQRLTTRTTIVATVDGNEVQIPNATIYKSVIRNFSTIPNCRVDFSIGVPRVDVDGAQQRAMDVLTHHPAVLAEPEPTVLVDSVNDANVSLRSYFWINGRENSWLKVRSSVMRLVMHAIDERAARTTPSESTAKPDLHGKQPPGARSSREHSESGSTGAVATKAEGNLSTEATEIKEQVKDARHDGGENLLLSAADDRNGSARHTAGDD